MTAMPDFSPKREDVVRVLLEAMEEAAEAAEHRGRNLVAEGEKMMGLGRSLIDQAAHLRSGAAELRGGGSVVELPPRKLGDVPPEFRGGAPRAAPPAAPPVEPPPAAPPAAPPPADLGPERLETKVTSKLIDPRLLGGEAPASVRGPKGVVTLATARDMARDLGEFSRAQFAEALGLKPLGVSRWLNALQEREIVKTTGTVYTFVNVELVPKPAAEAASPPAAEPAAPVADPPPLGELPPDIRALKVVRDFACEQSGTFSAAQVAAGTELPRGIVDGALEELVRQGVLTDESPAPDMPLFAVKDAAAKLKTEKTQGAATPIKTARGRAVKGTGKGIKANNPQVQATIDAVVRAYGPDAVEHAANGHFACFITQEDGSKKRVLIAATPSNARTIMNDRSRLRKAGASITV